MVALSLLALCALPFVAWFWLRGGLGGGLLVFGPAFIGFGYAVGNASGYKPVLALITGAFGAGTFLTVVALLILIGGQAALVAFGPYLLAQQNIKARAESDRAVRAIVHR